MPIDTTTPKPDLNFASNEEMRLIHRVGPATVRHIRSHMPITDWSVLEGLISQTALRGLKKKFSLTDMGGRVSLEKAAYAVVLKGTLQRTNLFADYASAIAFVHNLPAHLRGPNPSLIRLIN